MFTYLVYWFYARFEIYLFPRLISKRSHLPVFNLKKA